MELKEPGGHYAARRLDLRIFSMPSGTLYVAIHDLAYDSQKPLGTLERSGMLTVDHSVDNRGHTIQYTGVDHRGSVIHVEHFREQMARLLERTVPTITQTHDQARAGQILEHFRRVYSRS
ncbi:MAG: hypothetical protein V1708_06345 [Candidatus Micrarchaeota archaeon]